MDASMDRWLRAETQSPPAQLPAAIDTREIN
jgi:hypothetical protein